MLCKLMFWFNVYLLSDSLVGSFKTMVFDMLFFLCVNLKKKKKILQKLKRKAGKV